MRSPVLPSRPLYALMERFLNDYINSKAQRFNSETDSCTADLDTTVQELNHKHSPLGENPESAESNPQLNPRPLLCLPIFSLIAVRSDMLFLLLCVSEQNFICFSHFSHSHCTLSLSLRASQGQNYLHFLVPS